MPPPGGKGANEAVSLGKLDLDPKLTLGVQLLGGDLVAKGKSKFELQKDGDGATPGWSIEMAGKNKEAVKIARVWPEGNEWKIQWAVEAKDKPTLDKATLVRYCGLQFSCEKKTHFIALSAPKIVAPLMIDIDSGASRTRLSRDFPLPDLSLLRLQVLPLDPALPKHDFKILEAKTHGGRPAHGKPTEAVKGDKVPAKGHVFVVFMKEKTPRIFLGITFETHAKDVQLDVQEGCDMLNVPLNYTNLQVAAARVGSYLMATDSDKNPNKKNMQAQIERAKTTRDELKALGELATELNQKASIPFRVYAAMSETDDEKSPKVVIFQSGEVEEPKAGGTKKNAKGKQQKGRTAPEKDELNLK